MMRLWYPARLSFLIEYRSVAAGITMTKFRSEKDMALVGL